MTKRVLSLVLAVLMLFSIMPVYATDSASVSANAAGTASGVDGGGAAVSGAVTGGGSSAVGTGPYMTGKINVPSGYVFSGEERLEIYISENYESWGYEHYTEATINSDGTYKAYLPSDLTGTYAVSAYASDFSAPAIDGNYNCHNDAMITFTGSNVSGVDFTIEKGKTVSGRISLGEDAILENGMLYGWICAYEYDGEFIDMNQMGEGEFSKFFNEETGSFEYELTIRESVENIVLSVRARSEQMDEGAFKSNILDDYVYYAGNNSSLDYTQAQVIPVNGDTSGVDIQLHTGVGFAYHGKLPVDIYSQSADIYIEDTYGNELYKSIMYLDIVGSNGSTVFPKEYLNKEVYVYYDLRYNNDSLYTEPLYINPDGSLAKTKEEATPHKLTGANYVSFTAGLKSEFTTGIKGKITFEEGCEIGNGGGYYEVTAYNTDTGEYYYSGDKYITEVGEYDYVVPVTEEGNYKLWVWINLYSSNGNVSECDYYYTSEGMVYNMDDAEVIDTSVKNTGIDFELKKTKQFKGKIVADEDIVFTEKFEVQFTIQSDNGNYWENITLNDDLTFDVKLPVKIQGNCTAYLDVGTGSNVIPDCYFYVNDETNGRFDVDAGETVEFKLETGNLIKGKIKLPESISTTYSRSFEVCLATVNSNGYVNVSQRYYTSNERGTSEAEFMFAVSKTEQTEYILYGQLQGTVSGLYGGNFYYTGTENSSINQENAVKIAGGIETIVFPAIGGTAVPVTVTNPAEGEYLSGSYTIDFGNFNENRNFRLDAGQKQENSIVLTDEHIGLEAYVYYKVDSHYNTYIYVNPDGSLTNNKNEAKPHKITENTSFNITLSSDEELYTIPSIKGTLSLSESAYVTNRNGESVTISGTMYLIKDSWQEGYQYVEIGKEKSQEFNFKVDEIGDYLITLYLDNWSNDTNVVCNKTMYYTGDGWSGNREDAKLISNAKEQNLTLYAPELDVIEGRVEFAEGGFLDEEMPYQVTYTAVDGSGASSKSGYIQNADDFEYKLTGVDGADEYYVSIYFGSYYSQSFNTNIPYGKTYYFTENGLTTDAAAVRKAVKVTDNVVLNMPVLPAVKGTVKFPEDAELSDQGYVYIRLEDENGRQVSYRQIYTDTAKDFDFAIVGNETAQKYSISVDFDGQGYETNLEEGTLYYTKEGMTGSIDARKYYTIEELNGIELNLRKKRYVTGKLLADDFKNYSEEISGRVEIGTDTRYMYRGVTIDKDLNYIAEIPTEIDGEFTVGLEFYEESKNNIVKNKLYYYSDSDGNKKRITYPDCENINIEVETGYILSGVVKLPEDAIVYENQDISGSVYLGSYRSEFNIPYGKTEGEFFMTVPKTGYTGLLYTSHIHNVDEIAENLYEGMVYYKDENTSVVNQEDGTKIKVNKDVTDTQIMLLTGEVYNIEFNKPANITTTEQINVYAQIGEERIVDAVTISSNETRGKALIVVPEDYNGQQMYLYYDLYYDNSNTLYKEKVYINKDGTLSGSKKTAKTFEIGKGGDELYVELADYTEEGIDFPEYIYKSPYPYKDSSDNVFNYAYTGDDCDYLKVTFAEETYLAYEYYSRRDCLYIAYGDNEYLGPYYTNELAGKSVNVPAKEFTAYISQKAETSAFGFAIESIEPKKYTLETDHPYTEKVHPYTHKTDAEGLRLYFSEDTAFSGYMTVKYTHNGKEETDEYSSGNLAGRSIDVRGNNFTITLPENTSGNYYGFTIVEIEEIEYFDVTFVNYDGTELYKTEVEKGDSAYYYEDDPVRERDEDYIYIFEGWDKSLENITEDTVVTAMFSENPYATVQFKNNTEDTEPLYTDYVILGERASFDGVVNPSKASTETKGYIFTGWDRSLTNIKEDTVITAEFKEYDIILQYTSANKEQTYTYEGSADSIALVFSSDSKIGEDDYLYFYDEKGNEVLCINGETLTDGEYIIVGKTVTLRLDGENSYYALLEVAPVWHDFSDWRQYSDPDCTTAGLEYRYCYNCYTEEEREVPALGHSFGGWQEEYNGTIYRDCVRCVEREIFEGDMSDCGIVNINVVDAVTMKPLEFVTITSYDEMGNEAVWYTNEEGIASQMLPQGVNNLVVFLDGYIMRNIALDIVGGVTDVPVIGLTEKPAVQCKLEAKIMDMEEIKAAGIDTSDPLNSHVYKYKIDLGFGQPKDVYFNKAGDYIHRDGNLVVIHEATGTSATIHPVNDKYFLVIYGQSKWLKEMFDVELIAVNTSNTDTVENLVAELKLPDGMSLAAMNRAPQSDVQRMGSLASGESKSVHWYVRGDKEGEYNLSAKLTGTLMPFGEQFGYEYTTDEPVKVYAGSALKMNLVVPAVVTYGEDCIVKIEIENVSDRSVYNLSNSIDKVLQSKLLMVDVDGYEKYFEENALGYVAVDELKPGEKIVAEIKSNVLFKSDVIKDKISSLANKLQNETDILAIFNSYKSTLDLLNDNYDIIYNALGNVTRAKEYSSGLETLENILVNCEMLVKDGVSSRAMYFINRLKQENTMEELTKLSRDANFYTVWESEEINKLAQELTALYNEAIDPEKCGDYDIYEDVKRVIEAVPVSFWLDKVFVTKLEGSTTEIPYTVTVIPAEESYTGVTNISNYYYNILTNAIDILSQPWYTETMGKIRDPEGVAAANKIIKTDIGKTLTFAVTDVTGDTRFNAWVEGVNGKTFEISSTAENVGVTEGGITFTGPAYLSVSALAEGEGTLYVEKVSEVTTFAAEGNIYSFKLEAGEAHNCASEKWVEIVTAYDDNDGYYAKYCDICGELVDMKTDKATNDCSSGSYEVTELSVTDEGVSCKFTFDGETPARSAVAVVIMKDENGKAVVTGTDAIKIKPNSEVKVEVPFENAENLTPTILLWDSLARLRPVGSK